VFFYHSDQDDSDGHLVLDRASYIVEPIRWYPESPTAKSLTFTVAKFVDAHQEVHSCDTRQLVDGHHYDGMFMMCLIVEVRGSVLACGHVTRIVYTTF